MSVSSGEQAPSFELPGTDNTPDGRRTYTLKEFRGTPVVLIFYPGDNTPVCTRQLNAYTNDISAFADVGAQLLAVSPQGVQSHEDFSCKQGGFAFPLLADEDKAVGRAYGILGPLGLYRRSAFVVDGQGVIRYAHRAMAGLTFRPTNELVEAVKQASA
jgi:thioredoxin-dependent peroxiredoxin